MGRPLFSGAFRDSAPAVRVEPDVAYPAYEKWTQNAFDPDSEEWFESDDAVYEAFVDQEPRPELREGGSNSSRSPSPGRATPSHASAGAGVVVIEDASDVSSGSSEGTASGRESPMEGAASEDAGSDRGDYPGGYVPLVVRVPVNQTERTAGGLTRTRVLHDRPEAPHAYRAGDIPSLYNMAFRARDRLDTPNNLPSRAIDRAITTRTSDITPIVVRARAPATPPTPPPRLTTPPPAPQTPAAYMTPSPPPSVTPRLYHWSPAPAPFPVSPTPANRRLLGNTSARMSLAHIAPTQVEARHIRI
ncbi:hypothetical protein GLOTRDRAFT_128219 [Gloeophyllum trabeum ATCC 11539]|uniref:Uncharacterized protein n=1 Tax=Gloeophyllum trabeum (strain ATCC 11539 / FP-39264 / Madison 617) TaxID=670483 RepID=S7QBQ9_GLOTA|nr:uncharacterized protein GLOTRDRAFT_128219 [Gloeophyllum trabeum ATCC 11539]EPQ56798.1 hypothetical protein GLOTRDRAFT_128219 [Gloeophyllum trabeum ATCC 11539]